MRSFCYDLQAGKLRADYRGEPQSLLSSTLLTKELTKTLGTEEHKTEHRGAKGDFIWQNKQAGERISFPRLKWEALSAGQGEQEVQNNGLFMA